VNGTRSLTRARPELPPVLTSACPAHDRTSSSTPGCQATLSSRVDIPVGLGRDCKTRLGLSRNYASVSLTVENDRHARLLRAIRGRKDRRPGCSGASGADRRGGVTVAERTGRGISRPRVRGSEFVLMRPPRCGSGSGKDPRARTAPHHGVPLVPKTGPAPARSATSWATRASPPPSSTSTRPPTSSALRRERTGPTRCSRASPSHPPPPAPGQPRRCLPRARSASPGGSSLSIKNLAGLALARGSLPRGRGTGRCLERGHSTAASTPAWPGQQRWAPQGLPLGSTSG
jgi:hypothetical protein